MNNMNILKPNLVQNSHLLLEQTVHPQSEISEEKILFAIILVFLRNLLRVTLSRDKVSLAAHATYGQCEQLGLSKEQIKDILDSVLETGEVLRQSNPLSGMF